MQLFCRKTWRTKDTAKGNEVLLQYKAFELDIFKENKNVSEDFIGRP